MTDRRQFLATGLAGVAAGIVGAAQAVANAGTSLGEWDAAMANYTRTKAEMAAQTGDEVVNAFIHAENAILNMPAPNYEAIYWKLNKLSGISEHSVIVPEDFTSVLSDLRSLMGGLNHG